MLHNQGGIFMKKALSVILAIITMFSIAVPVFAVNDDVKDVDNTFDNYEPAPGQKAPDNWYDPYCYEADGRINKYCLNQGGDGLSGRIACYCPTYKKIFTICDMGRTTIPAHYENEVVNPDGSITYDYYPERTVGFNPYYETLTNWTIAFGESLEKGIGTTYKNYTGWYCPYCGMKEFENYTGQDNYKEISAFHSHPAIQSVCYGYWHEECDTFIAGYNFVNVLSDKDPFSFRAKYIDYRGCYNETDINTMKLYRFLSDAQRNAEYSFIFAETEKDFGDGKDGRVEDLKKDGNGMYHEWDSEDNPYRNQKLTFWQKIAAFFAKIGTWFKNLFK